MSLRGLSSNDHPPIRSISLGGERPKWTGTGALPPLNIADIAKMVTSKVIDGAPNGTSVGVSGTLHGQRDLLRAHMQVSFY